MRHKRIALILVLAGGLLLTTSVLAMSSTHYAVDWMVPLSGSGGSTSSSHYAADLTIGQTVTGSALNDSFQAGLGFWYGMRDYILEVMLPLLQK